jgi:hypothetical protein
MIQAAAVLIKLGMITVVSLPLAFGQINPECVVIGDGETAQSALLQAEPTQEEILARLIYADGLSTGFPDDTLVYEAIAWGVMNRVRLGEASPSMKRRYGSGIIGVVFKKGQFNPAVSPRSQFSKHFLCPKEPARWQIAAAAAEKALTGRDNPFIQTTWEKDHDLSLVVNFYYPQSSQARGPLPPWEGSPELEFVDHVVFDGRILPPAHIRFYRLSTPPRDI